MARRDWQQPGGPVAVFLNGDAIRSLTPQGGAIHDDSLILLLNAGHEPVQFTLPPRRFGAQWRVELSTIGPEAEGREYAARASVSVTDRSVTVLSRLR
jgi:glycogen operon protein